MFTNFTIITSLRQYLSKTARRAHSNITTATLTTQPLALIKIAKINGAATLDHIHCIFINPASLHILGLFFHYLPFLVKSNNKYF